MYKKLHQRPHSGRVEKRHSTHIQHKPRRGLRPHLLQKASDRFQHQFSVQFRHGACSVAVRLQIHIQIDGLHKPERIKASCYGQMNGRLTLQAAGGGPDCSKMELSTRWFNCYSIIPLLLTFVDAYAAQVYSWVAVDSLSDSNNSSRPHRPGKSEGHVLHKGPSWDGRSCFARALVRCFGISAVERHDTFLTIYISAIRL